MDTSIGIEDWFDQRERWHETCAALRPILCGTGLTETVAWGKVCYVHGEAKICLLQPMKSFLAVMFFKGVLVDDPEGLLTEQGENTHSARRLCLTSASQVRELEGAIRGLVASAVTVEAEDVPLPPRVDLELVVELQERLDADPELKVAFEALTPGRQRAYHLYVAGAKQSATRARRVEKHAARILAGKGLRDR